MRVSSLVLIFTSLLLLIACFFMLLTIAEVRRNIHGENRLTRISDWIAKKTIDKG